MGVGSYMKPNFKNYVVFMKNWKKTYSFYDQMGLISGTQGKLNSNINQYNYHFNKIKMF